MCFSMSLPWYASMSSSLFLPDSLITVDVMLAESGAFTGGTLRTLEEDGSLLPATFDQVRVYTNGNILQCKFPSLRILINILAEMCILNSLTNDILHTEARGLRSDTVIHCWSLHVPCFWRRFRRAMRCSLCPINTTASARS